MAVDLAAQANQANATGNAMLNEDRSNANNYSGQYNNYSNAANTANQNVNDYTKAMQGDYNATTGTGNAGSTYNYGLNSQLGQLGYDPAQMTAARANLNGATGALSAYTDYANNAASKWGMNAGGFAAANAGALGNLNNNIAANQGVVSGLSDLYKTAQTGANQFAGNVVQGQHETLAGLQNVYTNAANQRDSAGSMMNFYNDLAQKQGGLNAQQQQYYAQAQQAYASASQALAQASLLASQTTKQNLENQMTTNNINSKQYQDFLAGKVDANGKPINQTPVNAAPAGYDPRSGVLNKVGDFMANTAWGADASKAARGVGNWLGGLASGSSW